MNCTSCETYKKTKGKGSKACLTCEQYKQFNQEYSDRPSIKFVKVPDEILENVADLNSSMPDIIAALRMMDPDKSILIAAKYILGLSQKEIAAMFSCDQATISRQLYDAIASLKKNLSSTMSNS